MSFRGRWVLVTGATSGLGQQIAIQLAREHGANLVVAGRRAERLEELKRTLEGEAGVQVEPVVADMTDLEQVDRLFQRATTGRDLYAAILNAGVTHFGHHHELDWSGFETMLATNVTSTIRLLTQLVPYMRPRSDDGGIMLVASMAGLRPWPYQAAYSGTKAFLINFAGGLSLELHGTAPSITVYAPPGVLTEMTSGERFQPLRAWLAPVDRAARDGIDAFRRRRDIYIPGFINRIGLGLMYLFPRFALGRVAATYRRALERVTSRSPS
jgi:short-subunit dehydrogenase